MDPIDVQRWPFDRAEVKVKNTEISDRVFPGNAGKRLVFS